MRICYIDETGCTGSLPAGASNIQPVFAVVGLIIDVRQLQHVTQRFLGLKRQFYPQLLPTTAHALDAILGEVKGSELRKDIASRGRRRRRTAIGFLDKVVGLLETYEVKLVGRVWVKPPGRIIEGTAIYTSSIQAICNDFEHRLQQRDEPGFAIADSRTKGQNQRVSHSIFTQKFQAAGDAYRHLVEMPTFGHSDNHAGLQVADLVASALVWPMAIHSYCAGRIQNHHIRPGYDRIKNRYGERIMAMQYRYHDRTRWRGGITVSDAIARRTGGLLFR